jgi:hypothetical protein
VGLLQLLLRLLVLSLRLLDQSCHFSSLDFGLGLLSLEGTF